MYLKIIISCKCIYTYLKICEFIAPLISQCQYFLFMIDCLFILRARSIVVCENWAQICCIMLQRLQFWHNPLFRFQQRGRLENGGKLSKCSQLSELLKGKNKIKNMYKDISIIPYLSFHLAYIFIFLKVWVTCRNMWDSSREMFTM